MLGDKMVEFKREYVDDIKYTVIAFANTNGGTLYIGMNDDGTPCGVEDTDGTYSNLGMLLSEQCVHTIKMAVFDGDKKSIFRDRKELTGSLLQQLEDAYAYIDQLN